MRRVLLYSLFSCMQFTNCQSYVSTHLHSWLWCLARISPQLDPLTPVSHTHTAVHQDLLLAATEILVLVITCKCKGWYVHLHFTWMSSNCLQLIGLKIQVLRCSVKHWLHQTPAFHSRSYGTISSSAILTVIHMAMVLDQHCYFAVLRPLCFICCFLCCSEVNYLLWCWFYSHGTVKLPGLTIY